MPLLTRMIGAPLCVDIGPGAVAQLAPLLADRRISTGGHVAVVGRPGAGRGDRRAAAAAARERRHLDASRTAASTRRNGARASGCARASTTRSSGSAAGARSTSPSYAATLSGLPMVAVATSLAHDGIASPVASLEEGGRKGSYGVQMPIARGRRPRLRAPLASPAMRRSGIGDAISQPRRRSPTGGWPGASAASRSTALAVTFARTAAKAILHRTDGIDDEDFLVALAEALVLVGPRDGDRRLEPAVQRRRPRDPARDRPPLPRHRAPRRAGRRRDAVHVVPARRRGDGRRASTRA